MDSKIGDKVIAMKDKVQQKHIRRSKSSLVTITVNLLLNGNGLRPKDLAETRKLGDELSSFGKDGQERWL